LLAPSLFPYSGKKCLARCERRPVLARLGVSGPGLLSGVWGFYSHEIEGCFFPSRSTSCQVSLRFFHRCPRQYLRRVTLESPLSFPLIPSDNTRRISSLLKIVPSSLGFLLTGVPVVRFVTLWSHVPRVSKEKSFRRTSDFPQDFLPGLLVYISFFSLPSPYRGIARIAHGFKPAGRFALPPATSWIPNVVEATPPMRHPPGSSFFDLHL